VLGLVFVPCSSALAGVVLARRTPPDPVQEFLLLFGRPLCTTVVQ
jgi:hypothetical protein